MTDAILIFTFSPVQSFIVEARRAADLYTGSHILTQLAHAAAQSFGTGRLIYPASVNGNLPDDIPNVLVARLPHELAANLARQAEAALWEKWRNMAEVARQAFLTKYASDNGLDDLWEQTWLRQRDGLWQVYWALAPMLTNNADGYRQAYEQARHALAAVKNSRLFNQAEEPGDKDTLSGQRSALHTRSLNARDYWRQASTKTRASQVRPFGRERLDALGVIKRFGSQQGQDTFPSTSSVSSADFLEKAKSQAPYQLAQYRKALVDWLGKALYEVQDDISWPYDGDLLYMETLSKGRLSSSYGVMAAENGKEQAARQALKELYKAVDRKPSPYYALIQMDGDSMGAHIQKCLEEDNPSQAHINFSQQLSRFASQVKEVTQGKGFVIYNGGDDVLALAPLAHALPLAQDLAEKFNETSGGTASAGIAIAHHLHPLDAALSAARQGEKIAKSVKDKNAVCVQALKRSGETLTVCSPWDALGGLLDEMVGYFSNDILSSRLAYDVMRSVYALPDPDELLKAELRRLLGRHVNPKKSGELDTTTLAKRLKTWAGKLPGGDKDQNSGQELGRWLLLARFIAQGGGE